MTALIIAVVCIVVAIVAAGLGWSVGQRSRTHADHAARATILRAAANGGQVRHSPRVATQAPTSSVDHSKLRPTELLEPGTESADGRMSKAALLALIVASTEIGIAVVDPHRDVVLCNQPAADLGLVVAGNQLDDSVWVAAKRAFDADHEVDVDVMPNSLSSGFISTGRALSAPVAVRCQLRLVSYGNERYAVIYGTDDSENMRLEATRRDFVANVSHELKTPVGAIGLLAEALLESHDDPEAVAHFGERVITESTRMGNMVNELIALSRLQGAERLPDTESVSVDALIDEAVGRAQVGAEAAQITLHTDPPSGLVVDGDYTLLLTALNNLIANAIAYSPPNTVVSVSRRAVDPDTGFSPGTAIVASATSSPLAAISVTDRGIGIAARDQQRVFERFFRVDKARSRATGGTGLGLAIVKHVAANHDGTVTLWSRPGTGSTFTLAIPIAPPSQT